MKKLILSLIAISLLFTACSIPEYKEDTSVTEKIHISPKPEKLTAGDQVSFSTEYYADGVLNQRLKPSWSLRDSLDSTRATIDANGVLTMLDSAEVGVIAWARPPVGNGKMDKVIPQETWVINAAPEIKTWIENDAILLGILMLILAVIFKTSSNGKPAWEKFYKFVPALLLCYFLPSLLTTIPSTISGLTSANFKLISAEESRLYFVASRYLLPASLVFLCLSIDFQGIKRLGSKAVIMFLTGTAGIIIGGPVALLIVAYVAPGILGADSAGELWRGLATVAGSWIGGGANQTAMKEVFEVPDKMFSAMVTVDVIVANVWMALLLIGAGKNEKMDKWLKADSTAIEDVKKRMADFQLSVNKTPKLTDSMVLMAVGFGSVAVGHLVADIMTPIMNKPETFHFLFHTKLTALSSHFFWLVVVATTLGLSLSFTKLRNLEGVGASRMGSLFIYVLVATIGMKMDVTEIFRNPGLFVVGFIWMGIHAGLMLGVAKLIKSPFFFVAVGSQANVGGAASAPIVASAFNPALAPVGVLLAVLGYAVGTYGALVCAQLMAAVSP